MDSSKTVSSRFANWMAKTSVRVCIIAATVLVILAVLHVNRSQQNSPMRELLTGARLKNVDLQRMQLAFGQCGLSDFAIEDGKLLVPRHSHAQYLKAAADHDAVPDELTQSDAMVADVSNPFLSRTQQEKIDQTNKKTQIRNMIQRLPFVDQAWFEMDKSRDGSAFVAAKRSAVISIQTPAGTCLTDRHVATVKQMIGGAVADIAADQIVVIDLANGLAHQEGAIDQLTTKQRRLAQVAINQKRFYENRIRELLSDLPGLKVRVDVDVRESELPAIDQVTVIPRYSPPRVQRPLPTAGANGVIAIDDQSDPAELDTMSSGTPALLVGHETRSTVELERQLKISIDVPEATVYEVCGCPEIGDLKVVASAREASLEHQKQGKFEQLKSQIAGRVESLLAGDDMADGDHSLRLTLIDSPVVAVETPADWATKFRDFGTENWPSIAVLLIGVGLLTIVTRRPPPETDYVSGPQISRSQSSFADSSERVPEQPADDANAEVRLAQMIQEDPDSAAKIIESWIRDAA